MLLPVRRARIVANISNEFWNAGSAPQFFAMMNNHIKKFCAENNCTWLTIRIQELPQEEHMTGIRRFMAVARTVSNHAVV